MVEGVKTNQDASCVPFKNISDMKKLALYSFTNVSARYARVVKLHRFNKAKVCGISFFYHNILNSP